MNPLFKKNGDYICVTLSDEDVRIAYLKLDSSNCELISVIKRDIRGISEEELPKVIKSALKTQEKVLTEMPAVICGHLEVRPLIAGRLALLTGHSE